MALKSEYGKYKLACDYCEEEHEFDEWYEALNFMDAEGWIKHRIGNDWSHKCGDCA